MKILVYNSQNSGKTQLLLKQEQEFEILGINCHKGFLVLVVRTGM